MSSAQEELDKLYSPSQYNRRMTADEVITEHIRVITDESSRIRTGSIPSRLDVPYGESEREKLDIFGTDLPDESPIFVYFSGGYWQLLCGEMSAYVVEPMYHAKIVTIVVDYARAPGVTLSEIVGQSVNATKWIHDYATKKNSRSITLAGHSAGSHLCGMILCSPWFVQLSSDETSLFKGVFHLSGIFDIKPIVSTYVNEPLGLTVEEAEANSPLSDEKLDICVQNLIDKNQEFRTMIVVAEYESPAFKLQGEKLSQALISKGLKNVTFQIIPKVDHFNLVEKLSSKSYVVTTMIRSLIQN